MALNPQQQAFKEAYINPGSETFGNALRSALAAGYTQEYAESITVQGGAWFSEILGDAKRLQKAEKVLDKTLEMEPVDQEGKTDVGLLRVINDTAKFVASTHNKQKYSTKIESEVKATVETKSSLDDLPSEVVKEMRLLYERAMKEKLTKI